MSFKGMHTVFSALRHFAFLLFFTVTAISAVIGAAGTVSAIDYDALEKELQARAKEIEPMLVDNFCILPPIENREFWEKMAKEPSYKNVIKRVEKECETPLPDVPEELYLQFSQNGNRTNYQNAYNARNRGMGRAVLAECFENQGRFIPRIEEHLKAYFADKSWVLPAHDRSLKNFKGDYDVDLVSSDTAWNLATIAAILGDKLSAEVRAELDKQLEARCFTPFRNSVRTGKPKMWWIHGINNWNAVCLAGVAGAALTHIESREERAWFLAAVEKYIQNSNRGYAEDGYCTEGVGYWCYGFGHHTDLSETVRRATEGKIQILNQDKLRKVALYGFTIEILPGFSPSFADCGITAKPTYSLLALLNRYYGFHLDGYEYTLPVRSHALTTTGIYGTNLPPFPAEKENGMATVRGEDVKVTNRTWFPEAQILILRPEGWKATQENLSNAKKTQETIRNLPGFAVAMKGGHNDEEHNHNDVGTYVLIYRGTLPALDLGSEVYTARTFSKDRYVSDVLNSWGHNVPVVAGKLQNPGRQYEATVLETDFNEKSERLLLDLKKAYTVTECETLTREFVYSREKVQFSVTDAVKFSSPQSFETALVTIQSWKRDGNSVIFGEDENAVRAEIVVKVDGKVTDEWTLEEAGFEADFKARDVARRLGVKLNSPVKNATIRVTYTPVN
ncbi:MAG: hypothetical protein Q4C70_10030 [Planctomycetia bacterium]|nr:hypothetical protein [Planctomycetia bacterium]